MKNTRALAHIRQLCCLGVESHAVIPAVTAALHELIPSAHNLFVWTDKNGQAIDQYCEAFNPIALEAAKQNLDGKPDLPALVRSEKPVGNLRERSSAFYETPHFHEAYRPMRVRHSLDAVIRTPEGPQGIFVLHRDSGQAFTKDEERDLESVLPYLRNIWVSARSPHEAVFADSAEQGVVIACQEGRIQHLSSSALQLMLMAQTHGLLTSHQVAAQLPEELMVLVNRLVQIDQGVDVLEPPVLHLSNRWGKFVFRAMWLDGFCEGNDRLVSINISRQEPLPVSIVRGFQRSPLSPKQRDVALMLVTGRSAEEIVRELSITTTTYKDHLRKIYEKLGINKRADLIRHLTQPSMA
jgi:DNA-binding CsgD family transcriptional regulator